MAQVGKASSQNCSTASTKTRKDAGAASLEGEKSIKLDWVTSFTRSEIKKDLGKPFNTTCGKCGYKCKIEKRHKLHVRRHYIRYYCCCGFHHDQYNMVSQHQKDCKVRGKLVGYENTAIFQVCKRSHQAWTEYVSQGDRSKLVHLRPDLAKRPKPMLIKPKTPAEESTPSSGDEVITWRDPGRLRNSTRLARKYKACARPPIHSICTCIRELHEQAAALRAAADRLDAVVARLQRCLATFGR